MSKHGNTRRRTTIQSDRFQDWIFPSPVTGNASEFTEFVESLIIQQDRDAAEENLERPEESREEERGSDESQNLKRKHSESDSETGEL